MSMMWFTLLQMGTNKCFFSEIFLPPFGTIYFTRFFLIPVKFIFINRRVTVVRRIFTRKEHV